MSNGDQPDPALKAPKKLAIHMENLPEDVKERVTSLQEIQKKHDEIEAEFKKERAILIEKYQKLYAPFYEQRTAIVNGADSDEKKPAEENGSATKGVPDFWLYALKANEIVGSSITEKDEGALKYLKDIKAYHTDEPKGFKLEFYFAENPYFTNTLLTKEYHMVDEDEPILERATGTLIDWKPGKNLTVKLMKKKIKKGAKNTNPETKLQDVDSFFRFFSPPEVPDDDADVDPDVVEDIQDVMELDYDVGSTIRDKVIPHAVSWYTGEAAEDEFEDEDDDEDDDEESDEEDEEDDEDDLEEECSDEEDEIPKLVKKEDEAPKVVENPKEEKKAE